MLQELYRYAVDNKLTARAGFKPKSLKAYLMLDAQGNFLGLTPALEKQTMCPDLGSAAQSATKCNILAEKAETVLLCFGEENSQERAGHRASVEAKHRFFLDALRDGQSAEPRFGVVLRALEDETALARMREAFNASEYKKGDIVGFQVDGFAIEQSCAYAEWWDVFRAAVLSDRQSASDTLPRCLITGIAAQPMQTVPKVSGLLPVGGHSAGDALLCFDKSAFCSYGLEQSWNAPVSEEAMTAVNAALTDLIRKAPILCGAKYIHWYDRPLGRSPDLLDSDGLFPAADDTAGSEESEEDKTPGIIEQSKILQALEAAKRLIESAKNGERSKELDARYYLLALSGASGRMMIRSYLQGSYEELYQSMKAWFDDLRLVLPSGVGLCKPPKLFALHIRLLKPENNSRNISERMQKELAGVELRIWFSILQNKELPDTVAVRALAYIRSGMLKTDDDSRTEPMPDAIACQWLKMWLLRHNRKKGDRKGGEIMEALNKNYPSVAYQAGRMMAVFAQIQKDAYGRDVKANVIQRYYASASSTPALVLGKLAQLSQYHLGKIQNKGLVIRYERLLDEIAQKTGNKFPATLTLEQQSEFALGYYQQRADLFTKPEKPEKNELTEEEED